MTNEGAKGMVITNQWFSLKREQRTSLITLSYNHRINPLHRCCAVPHNFMAKTFSKFCYFSQLCMGALSSVMFDSFWHPNYPGPPSPSVHGILFGKMTEWVAISSSKGIFLTQQLNSRLLLHWQEDSLILCH